MRMLRATLGLTFPVGRACACHTRASASRGATYASWAPRPRQSPSAASRGSHVPGPPAHACAAAAARPDARPWLQLGTPAGGRAGGHRMARVRTASALAALCSCFACCASSWAWSTFTPPGVEALPSALAPPTAIQASTASPACRWRLRHRMCLPAAVWHPRRLRPLRVPPCSGECMTVQVTFTYTVDPETLRVDTCGIVWGAVHGLQLHGGRANAGRGVVEQTGAAQRSAAQQIDAAVWCACAPAQQLSTVGRTPASAPLRALDPLQSCLMPGTSGWKLPGCCTTPSASRMRKRRWSWGRQPSPRLAPGCHAGRFDAPAGWPPNQSKKLTTHG